MANYNPEEMFIKITNNGSAIKTAELVDKEDLHHYADPIYTILRITGIQKVELSLNIR